MKIKEKDLKKILANLFKMKISEINDNLSMNNCRKWDSLNHLKMIIAIESKFDISFQEKEVVNITSFKLIKLYLKKLKVEIL